MLKRLFSVSRFQQLTLTGHIFHSLLTYGLLMGIVQFFFAAFLPPEYHFLDRLVSSLLVAVPSGLTLGLIEYAAVAAWNKTKNRRSEKG
jgi:hypothetical protein